MIVAASNLAAIYPIYFAYYTKPYICASLVNAMFWSLIYHLCEHKHGLRGYGKSYISKRLLYIDFISASILFFMMLYKSIQNQAIYKKKLLFVILLGFVCLYFSERKTSTKWLFVFWHSLWHILAFSAVSIVLQ
jgi:hypothetical protein